MKLTNGPGDNEKTEGPGNVEKTDRPADGQFGGRYQATGNQEITMEDDQLTIRPCGDEAM